jgi:hypothetical protein
MVPQLFLPTQPTHGWIDMQQPPDAQYITADGEYIVGAPHVLFAGERQVVARYVGPSQASGLRLIFALEGLDNVHAVARPTPAMLARSRALHLPLRRVDGIWYANVTDKRRGRNACVLRFDACYLLTVKARERDGRCHWDLTMSLPY